MGRIGRWMFIIGITLGIMDMLLITLMPERPLPRGVGFLMPCGIGLCFFSSFFRNFHVPRDTRES